MENRRNFIKKLGIVTSSIPFIGGIQTSYGANLFQNEERFLGLKIKGRVVSGSKGISKVVVTDGRTLVQTDKNGEFEINSANDVDFVYISLPAGYEIDQLKNGSANYFKKVDKFKKEQFFTFDLEPLKESDKEHHFLLLADPQIQNEYEAEQLINVSTPDFIETIKDLKKSNSNVFGIGCGDLVFDHLELFESYNTSVKQMDVPFFQVIGNHDMDLGNRTDEMTAQTFNTQYGPTYYSFNRGDVHYVTLDDVFFIGVDKQYIGYVNEQQLAWLEKDLSFVKPGTTVIVSLHIPTYTGSVTRHPEKNHMGGTVSNRAHLYKLLAPFNTHIMSGHTHFNDNMVLADNLYEHCHGTVCGAWWSGPICFDGTPSGYAVYSVKGSELSWYYKSFGKDKSHQFRVYPKGENKEFKEEWSVNVWNWDPEWKVMWYENGKLKGDMIRITSLDPLSIKLHKGPKLPERRTWVEPQLTDHMFVFKPSKTAKTIKVEVTDRFGNVYSQEFKN
ncbi:calcineurin-like phosphoesterase family protein [Wenyingzhuangia sp. 2_MG-2023]|uniref:calcineurin-like phosphoesterase family protein n=1 Tax=Wenyingzhuangia sp. 2_MG-2023 TaxID=3062639 RepID=UPI0026E16249|nr:calcineurin-like phosphoesterase family protein [Wenyingzhuangia sp. 2_MG-2023]MDO6738753.1 calcineurin-like phosphoesterase family protein [Wenyingzhuangia sp. 2_MG-2023]